MYTLSNNELSVQILDPIEDASRFGPRYCTGGYIFQIEDAGVGPLLTGPTYPDDFNWFDGQGIPDAFNLGALREPGAAAPESLVPGIGICDMGKREVLDYCRWNVDQRDDAVTMSTDQSFGSFGLSLERSVALSGRVVRSETKVTNTGKAQLPIHWFPHPFFPYHQDGTGGSGPLCRLPGRLDFDRRSVYSVDGAGYVH